MWLFTHDHRLVVLSILISIVAAYAWRALAERLRVARGRPWVAWFAGAAIVDGISTWSMHYTGMLALRLPAPLMFDWREVILSFFVGVGGSALALLSLGRGRISWLRALTTGIFLGGIGISGLHYSAMWALRVRGLGHEYSSPALVTASVLLAILISAAVNRPRNGCGGSNPVSRCEARSRPLESMKRIVGTPTMLYCFVSFYTAASSLFVRSALMRTKRSSSAATAVRIGDRIHHQHIRDFLRGESDFAHDRLAH